MDSKSDGNAQALQIRPWPAIWMMIHPKRKMNTKTLKVNIQDDAKMSLIALTSFLRNMPNDRDHGARDTSFQRCMANQFFGRFFIA